MRDNFECSHVMSDGTCRRWQEPCSDKKNECEADESCYDCMYCVYPASQEPCASCSNSTFYPV